MMRYYADSYMIVTGHSIKVFHHKAPADIPWQDAGVQYVVEASGMFTSVGKASGHLTSVGVRRVVITAPSADAPMLILGVNENTIQPDMKVVSCASSTLYCLAPIIKVLEDAFGVDDGFVTSIHAMTPSLKPLDGLCVRGKHWRDHRSIVQNIIPAATGACRALGKIIPNCKDKLAGLAFRVPVVNGSVLDMTLRLNKNTTIAEISKTIEDLNNCSLRNIIQVSNEKSVSSDFMGDKHSCILDIDSSLQMKPNFFKLICWYENEYSYSCRVIDTVLFLERQFQTHIFTPTRLMYKRPLSGNLHNIEKSQGDVGRPYVSFCFPGLQHNRPTFKPSLQNLEIRATTAQNAIQELAYSSIRRNKESIKSYIERLTKCKCNEKTVPRKYTKEDNEHKAENCFKKVEKEVSEMLIMAEDMLNKSCSRKLQSSKKCTKLSEEESKNRDTMRKNIIAKISDTLEKIREVKMCTLNTSTAGDQKTDARNHEYEDKASLPSLSTREAGSLNIKNSLLKVPKPNSPIKTVNSRTSLNTLMNQTFPDYQGKIIM
ncbi:glyceraldehyde-3-phosphate dehydrogenase-like isoform X2 [Leguminivora glycinivorella]|uniref:glyceraldehyde-3-phosphate dehydrogenase-like isoform X2 n=1 Tax=Leguminivora glycinivorella TaxID=1035111 RepID=UPI00201066A8|nr:glyceraldehyde-3-phosphate dehydrogenase-like isoform X2 [Leguminivora glycinivorella]